MKMFILKLVGLTVLLVGSYYKGHSDAYQYMDSLIGTHLNACQDRASKCQKYLDSCDHNFNMCKFIFKQGR